MSTFTKLLSTFLLTVALVFAGSTAYGQLEETQYLDEAQWEWNVNSGVLLAQNDLYTDGFAIDDESLIDQGNLFEGGAETQSALGVGTDLTYRFDNGVTLGGQFSWSPLARDINEEALFNQPFQEDPQLKRELNLYMYSANIGYRAAQGRFGLHAAAGIGAATQAYDTQDIEEFINENDELGLGVNDIFSETDTQTRWQTPVTLGAQYAVSRSVTINAMARDYIIYGTEGNNVSNNLYFGGGVSFMF